MTHKEVNLMVKSMGLPYAYYQFPENTQQAPPFICYFYSGTSDFFADQENYQRIEQLNIEFYTKRKDFAKEEAIEAILKANGLTFTRQDSYIGSEKIWQIAYEMDVLITPERNN